MLGFSPLASTPLADDGDKEITLRLIAQESGADTLTGSVGRVIVFDLAAQEAGTDRFSGAYRVADANGWFNEGTDGELWVDAAASADTWVDAAASADTWGDAA